MDEISDGLRDVVARLPATIFIMRNTSTCLSRATSGKAVLRNALHVRRRVPLGLACVGGRATAARNSDATGTECGENKSVASGECHGRGERGRFKFHRASHLGEHNVHVAIREASQGCLPCDGLRVNEAAVETELGEVRAIHLVVATVPAVRTEGAECTAQGSIEHLELGLCQHQRHVGEFIRRSSSI